MTQSNFDDEIKPYTEKIKSAGMRVTEQRKAILKLLINKKRPFTVSEAFDILNKNKKKKVADLASMYRIFEVFEDLEVIHQVSHNSYVLCQHLSCEKKYHVLLNCKSCQGFIEMHIPNEAIETFATFIRKNKKFQIDQHPLGLNGLCANCR